MSFEGNKYLDKLPCDARVTLVNEIQLLHLLMQELYVGYSPSDPESEVMLRQVMQALTRVCVVNSKLDLAAGFLIAREVLGQIQAKYPPAIAEVFEETFKAAMGPEGAHIEGTKISLRHEILAMDATVPEAPEPGSVWLERR